MPIVSVIIPLYNKSRYIGRALQSVFAQTLTDYEVIVVDDGSTDDGLDIVGYYNDPRLKIIRQENAGPGAARNKGVREAKARYLAFLDADDEWLPEYLQASYEILQQEPGCEICVSSRFINVGNEVIESNNLLSQMSGRVYSGLWQIEESISDRELEHIIRAFHADTFFITRKLCLSLGGFSEINHFGEDWHLWIQSFINHRIFFNKAHLAIIHAESSGICSQGLKRNPIQAYFIDAENIKAKCSTHKNLLERFMAIHALRHAHVRAGVGNFTAAEYLVKHFPQMKKINFVQYIFLRLKLFFPKSYQWLQQIIAKA